MTGPDRPRDPLPWAAAATALAAAGSVLDPAYVPLVVASAALTGLAWLPYATAARIAPAGGGLRRLLAEIAAFAGAAGFVVDAGGPIGRLAGVPLGVVALAIARGHRPPPGMGTGEAD